MSLDEPVVGNQMVQCLRINRNSVYIGDSDSLAQDRNQRVQQEMRDAQRGFCWIMQGRDIENHLTPSILATLFPGVSFPPISPTDKVVDVLGSLGQTKNKKTIAINSLPHWTKDEIRNSLDLAAKLDELVAFIKRANDIE